MAQLTLDSRIGSIPTKGKPLPSFSRVWQDEAATTATYTVGALTQLHVGNDVLVYKGTLVGHPSQKDLDVVLKTDIDARYPRYEEFEIEANNYRLLSPFQGRTVPNFYGLFQATIHGKLVSILVLDYCGEMVPYNIEDEMDDNYRREIFRLVGSFHYAGFQHNDLSPGNVLQRDDGRLFLIDFERLEPHKCGIKQKVIPGDFEPLPDDFGCAELHELVSDLGFWESSSIDFYGHKIHVSQFKTGCAAKIVGAIPEFLRRGQGTNETMMEEAEKDIERIEAHRAEMLRLRPPESRTITNPHLSR